MHTYACDYVRMWYIHTDSDDAVHYALGMPRYKNFMSYYVMENYVSTCHMSRHKL